MKHIRKFESHTFRRKVMEIIKEDVIVMGDVYKVRTSTDVTQSMINSVIKSAKEKTGVNLRQKYSDVQLAEMIADYTKSQLNADNIPVQVFTGGEIPPAQGQAANQVPMSAQQQPTQVAPMAAQPAVQGQPVQGQSMPAQGQPVQGQPVQGQPVQGQPEQVAPVQNTDEDDFEEIDPTKDKDDEDEEDDENNELPV